MINAIQEGLPIVDESGIVDPRMAEFARAIVDDASISAWNDVSFLNSWSNLGGAFANVQFRALGNKRVEIRGAATGGTLNSNMFVLPTGFIPADRHAYSIVSNSLFGRIDVREDGGVRLIVGSNVSAFFSGITFSLD